MNASKTLLQRWYIRFLAGLIITACFVFAVILWQELLPLWVVLLVSSMISIEYLRGGSYSTIGFGFDSWTFKEVLIGMAAGIIPILLLVGIYFSFGWISVSITNVVPWNMMSTIILLAITEEMIFRGTIFQALHSRFSLASVAIISSLLFAFAHGANPSIDMLSLSNTFLANCVFIAAWNHTKGLWLPIAFHISWNMAQFLSGLVLSGASFGQGLIAVRMVTDIPEPWLYSAYGIEGSVFCSVILIVMLILIFSLSTSPYRIAALFGLQYPKINTEEVRHITLSETISH